MGWDVLPGFLGVRPLMRRRGRPLTAVPFTWLSVDMESRERLRARFSSEESEPEPSLSSAIGSGDLCRCCLAAERVTGAK